MIINSDIEKKYKHKQITAIKNMLISKEMEQRNIKYINDNMVDKHNKIIDDNEINDRLYNEAINMYNDGFRINSIIKEYEKVKVGRKKTDSQFTKKTKSHFGGGKKRRHTYKYFKTIKFRLKSEINILEQRLANCQHKFYLITQKSLNDPDIADKDLNKNIIIKPCKFRNLKIMVNFFYKYRHIKGLSMKIIITDSYKSTYHILFFESKKKILTEFTTFEELKKINPKFIVIYLIGFIAHF